MNIAVIGVGTIGKTLAQKLQAHGHQVRIANSRGPESLKDVAREIGATAATVAEAVQGAEVIVLTIPLGKTPTLREVFRAVPPEVIVVETMNYYPQRDGAIAAIEQGMVHSAWVAQTIGHPVIKAFNNIGSFALYAEGQPAGTPGRIALSVSGDDAAAKQTVIELVNQTGFDGYDAGPLADSWRQQPGTPAYCTNLPLEEAQAARARAVRADAPANQDLIGQQYANLGPDFMQVLLTGIYPDGFVDHGVDINRAHFGLSPRAKATQHPTLRTPV
jgi:predicted dinucleotide-binding enzyme